MSVRPPQALDRLSGLSSSPGDSAAERRSPGHRRQPSDASDPTGLVQRCVIIQRDQHGFGFTVSGDRVVLVQSVRPGGAAMKAGVQEGDRIVKVNGTMVTNSSHLEVVKLIKSGAYVALTLLGSPPAGSVGIPGSQQDSENSGCVQNQPQQRITDPKPLQDPEVQKHAAQILRNMLRQEEAELQRLQELYSRSPGAALEEQMEGARRRVSQLQLKVLQESHGAAGRFPVDSQDGDALESAPDRLPTLGEAPLPRNSVTAESPRTSPELGSRKSQHRRQGSESAFPTEQGSGRPLIIGPEEDCDPGYSNNECDWLFQDVARLKSRPAHLGVFLRFLFSQADPSPLLFHLCSDVCQQSNPKDSRALGRDIWNIFLDRNAPLRVKVPEQLLVEIEIRLRSGDDVRPSLLEAQESVLPEIQEQLQDYRTKRTLGLGSLYGENELLELDGSAQRERSLAERQLGHLGDILSKYEEERSSPMAFALATFMGHAGLRSREIREKIPEKDKWLSFFPKAKKSSSSKKEKDSLEDKRRNPILKYIGKPKISSQSTFHVPLSPVEVRPGNVRTMIQHFENSHGPEGAEPTAQQQQQQQQQRLSTGSAPDELLQPHGSRCEVRLGRSESLKGREELRKSRKSELVPRSRSDVDMDAAAEASRLHQSASSSASSLSARSLENPTPPYTPKMGRRSIESPSLGFGADPFLPHLLEDDQGPIPDPENSEIPQIPPQNSQNSQKWQNHPQNWQHSVSREVVANLSPREVERQEVINELFGTEFSHLRTLRALDLIFFQRLKRESLLAPEELGLLFPNLPDLIRVHDSLWDSMQKLREEQGPIIRDIGDLMLARFAGAAREEFQAVAATFCSGQSQALELIRAKQRKDSRFQLFMQEAEAHPQCRRLQLKDLIVAEMQRLTKYPLLLENVLKFTPAGSPEQEKLLLCRNHCRDIVRFVNEEVKRAENQLRLQSYQKRLDTSSLERTTNPLAAEFRNLDLTSRRMIHEGPLAWRVGKDKTLDLHVLLLEDLLVLLQRQDERLILKCHGKGAAGVSSDTKGTFSPVLKLCSLLVRSVATDKRALFIICTSELGPQIYELVALTSSEKNTWMELLEQAVQDAASAGIRTRTGTGTGTGTASGTATPERRGNDRARTGTAGLVLPGPDVSPVLSRGSGAEPGAEDCSSADSDDDPNGDPNDVPNDVPSDVPNVPSDDPNVPNNDPSDDPNPTGRAKPQEQPLEDPGGVPRAISGVPRAIPSVPGAIPGVPMAISGVPMAISGVPMAISGVPGAISGVPRAIPSVPRAISGVPMAISGVPGAIPSVPMAIPGVPGTIPSVPRAIPSVPRAIPSVPMAIPGVLDPFLLPTTPGSAGVAEAALEDVETLRLLLLRRLRPGRDRDPDPDPDPDPEDDVTPTPSAWDSAMSGRNLGMSSQDLGPSSRDLGMSSRDLGPSSRDLGMSSQDLGMSGQDLGMSSQDLGMSGQDLGMSSQDLGMSGRDLGMSSQDLPTSSWNSGMSGRDLGPSSRELPTSTRDSAISTQDLPMSTRDLPTSGRDLSQDLSRDSPMSSRDLSQDSPMSTRDLSRDSPMSSRDLSRDSPMSSRDLSRDSPMSSRDLGPSSRDLPTSSWNSGMSSQDSATSTRDSTISSRDLSQDSPMSSRDSAMSSQDLPMSSQDLGMSSRDLPTSSWNSGMSSQDSAMSSQDFPVSSQDLLMSSRDLPTSSWNSGMSSRDSPMSSRDLSQNSAMSGQDLPMSTRDSVPSSWDSRMSSQDLVTSSRELPMSSRDLGMSSRDSGMSGWDSGMSSRDLPMSTRDLPTSGRDLPISGHDSALSSQESATSTRDLSRDSPMSTRDLSRDSGMSGRDFPMSTRDLSRDSPMSTRDLSRDSPMSTRDLSRDSPMSTRDLSRDSPMSTRDLSRDSPMSTRDLSRDSGMSGRDFPMSTRDLSRDSPMSGQDSVMSTRDFPTSTRDFPVSNRDFPMSSQDFPMSNQDFPMSTRDFSRDFPMSTRDSGMSARDLAMSSRDFLVSTRDFSMSGRDLGMSTQDLGMSGRNLGMSGRDLSTQEGSREEPEPNGIQIVRKGAGGPALAPPLSGGPAQEEGPGQATPPRGCSQSEAELRRGGGASAEGNCFYLSLPRAGGDTGDTDGDIAGDTARGQPGDIAGDIRDTPRGRGDSDGDIAEDTARGQPGDIAGDTDGDIGDTPRGRGDIAGDVGDTDGDTELILGTLEELRGKLHRLRALEVAHQRLLRSLGGGDATPTPPGVPSDVPNDVPNDVPTAPDGATRGRALRGQRGDSADGTGSEAPPHL